MDYSESIKIVITIRESRDVNVTINAACDKISSHFLKFCTGVGAMFEPEIKIGLEHISNGSRYQYLYRVGIKNKVYGGNDGRKILLAMYRCYRWILDCSSKASVMSIDKCRIQS